MINEINRDIKGLAIKYSLQNPYTNVYGLARSLMAFATLLTLVFNDWGLLFPAYHVQSIPVETIFDQFNIFLLFGYDHIRLVICLCIFLLCLVMTGILPQVTSVFHFWIAYSFFRCSPTIDGGDQIISIITLLLIPFSFFDNRFNHWNVPKEGNRRYINIFANVVMLFIQIQISALYFHSVVEKLKIHEWVNGTDVYYWFSHNVFGLPSWLRFIEPVFYSGFIVTTFTWGTLLLELFLFVAIFMSGKWRKRFFVLGVFFHFGILLVHGLVSFFFAMAGSLILYLIPAHHFLCLPNSLKITMFGMFRRSSLFLIQKQYS